MFAARSPAVCWARRRYISFNAFNHLADQDIRTRRNQLIQLQATSSIHNSLHGVAHILEASAQMHLSVVWMISSIPVFVHQFTVVAVARKAWATNKDRCTKPCGKLPLSCVGMYRKEITARLLLPSVSALPVALQCTVEGRWFGWAGRRPASRLCRKSKEVCGLASSAKVKGELCCRRHLLGMW